MGQSMRDVSIADGDVLVVDRAVPPRSGHVVVAVVDSEFTVKTFWKHNYRMKFPTSSPAH